MHDEWPVLACWSGTIKVRRSLSAIGRPHTSHSGTGAWLLPTRTSLTADRQKLTHSTATHPYQPNQLTDWLTELTD